MSARSSNAPSVIVAVAAGIALLYFFRDVLIPFVLALVVVVLVNALVRFVGNRAPGAPLWTVVSLAGLIVLSGAVAVAFILFEGAANLVRQAPDLVARIEHLVAQGGRAFGLGQSLHLATLIGDIPVPELAGSIAGGVTSSPP